VLEELAAVGQDFHSAVDAFGAGDDAAAVPAIDRLDRMSEKALLESLARYVASKPPDERREITNRFKRNLKLVRDLKRLYEGKCQICGFTFEKNRGGPYCEAAHLDRISLREADLDVKDNIVILCPNHHKMLDHGPLLIEFDPATKELFAVIAGHREEMTNKHIGF
ncbi:MAG TPA: HNH endonuclease, partial [Solirubrobacterales bacterium]